MRMAVRRTGRGRALPTLLPRRARLRSLRIAPPGERRTLALGLVGLSGTAAVLLGEVGRVWRRGSAPLPAETDDVLEAAGEAARQTIAVARAGYREGSRREASVLNMLMSFVVGFGGVRAVAYMLRTRDSVGPFRDVVVGRRHIHHFVPGIVLAFAAGAASIISRDEGLDPWFAIPFGLGLGLTLDESALLLELDDVYWTEAGVISVQVGFAALSMMSALVLGLRLLARGERHVLERGSSPEGSPSPEGG